LIKILKFLLTVLLINSVNAGYFDLEIQSLLMVMNNIEKYNQNYKGITIKYNVIPVDNCTCIVELSKNITTLNTLKVNICNKKIEEINV
tara:strand:- start:453 stop:719 length:267 start_codon:yes stop_codon:yes gene_type:complete